PIDGQLPRPFSPSPPQASTFTPRAKPPPAFVLAGAVVQPGGGTRGGSGFFLDRGGRRGRMPGRFPPGGFDATPIPVTGPGARCPDRGGRDRLTGVLNSADRGTVRPAGAANSADRRSSALGRKVLQW